MEVTWRGWGRRLTDLVSRGLLSIPFILPLSSGVSDVSARLSPSCPPESGSAVSSHTGLTGVSSTTIPVKQLLLELDSASESDLTSDPKSSSDELDSLLPPHRDLKCALWL